MSSQDQDENFSFDDLNANSNSFPFLKNLNIDQDVERRLTLQLQSIIKGNSEVFTTPICKRIEPVSILKQWDEIFKANKGRMNSTLIDLEVSNRSKFGPRSIAKPWVERIDDVSKYYHDKRNIRSPISSRPALKPQNLQRFRPLEPNKAVDLLKNSTNSGLPFYCRKSKIKRRLIEDFDYLKYRKDPCLLFTRTQENNKTRTVWGYPAIDTLIEMCYYAVLLTYQKTLDWRAAIRTPEDVDREVTRIIDKAISNSLSVVSIDFSAYDSSISVGLIKEAFEYIKSLFQPIYHDTIDIICHRFYSIPLLTPSGIIRGNHGVPSGSTFTNEVDSIVQYLVAKSSNLIYDGDFQIQGDDGVYAVSDSSIDDFLNTFDKCGLNVNKDKSDISKNYCIYLQKLYHKDLRGNDGIIGGIYPTYRALNRIIYQERWSNFEDFDISGQDYYSLRTISILENCKHHPLFKEFVTFVYNLDKYSLGYTREGLSKYINMLSETKGDVGSITNQYGDCYRGLKRFQTVKIINSLA